MLLIDLRHRPAALTGLVETTYAAHSRNFRKPTARTRRNTNPKSVTSSFFLS